MPLGSVIVFASLVLGRELADLAHSAIFLGLNISSIWDCVHVGPGRDRNVQRQVVGAAAVRARPAGLTFLKRRSGPA